MVSLSKKLLESNEKYHKTKSQVINETLSKGICVCIIDDSPTIREGIVSAINIPYINQVITTSKADYLNKHKTKQIDIIVTEMEFGNGKEDSFIEQIKSISPKTKFIVYTRIENFAIRNRLLKNRHDAFIFSIHISPANTQPTTLLFFKY